MAVPAGWDAHKAVDSLEPHTFAGAVYRAHSDLYEATDATGSLLVSGRWNLGRDRYPEDRVFPALYAGVGDGTTFAEVLRHVGPGRIRRLRHYVLSQIRVELPCLDLCDPDDLGLRSIDALLGRSYRYTHALAEAVHARGTEALLVRSSTLHGDALVIFTRNRAPDSVVEVVRTTRLQLRP